MRDARIEQPFADGEYSFRLGWGEIVELQEKVDCGPFALLDRINSGQWLVGDLSETIRLGLIGGGLKPTDAKKLVDRYVTDRPPLENLELARAVLLAGLVGAPDEAPGEDQAPAVETP